MENRVYYNDLFDYYGSLFTETQRNYFIAYYFDNLLMEEIASNYQISKNAISKTLKEVKEKLDYYESNLHLYENKAKVQNILKNNPDILAKIDEYI
jgi:predicted DNA-binding protein YlxM (UPF0122 family)